MCSIMFYKGRRLDLEAFTKHLRRTAYRGPDMERVMTEGDAFLGFERLAIMGPDEKGMQPFCLGRRSVICNGEIYGFEKIRKSLEGRYEFSGNSDCEVILPLYEEYGTDMFAMLDAEFAMVIYDGSTAEAVAARDPIGIRPLYYGYDEDGMIAFASEPRNLLDLCSRIMPFPPGHYWKDGRFVCYMDISRPENIVKDSVETAAAKIREHLVEGVVKRLRSDVPTGFLLSGGLDSSLVCAVAARESGRTIRTFSIGMDTDPIDLGYARRVATYLGTEHTEIRMDKDDVLDVLDEVIGILGSWDITTIRASIGMYLVCRYIHEHTDIKVLLTGEVSDELFGYKYTDFAPSAEEFQAEAEKRVRELNMYDVLRADRCISANSLEARVPFGDIGFVRYVMALSPERKMNTYGIGKYLLRKAFEEGDYLPHDILMREKAAFSDAVGHSMVDILKAYAEAFYTDEEFDRYKAGYSYCPPFTKESLLYRQIFDRHYPGQERLIADYWMPNRKWKGCDTGDPSARYLSNYGKSGT